ncbi:MAG: DUF3168 domain-containing protein, partial [Sandarakinorhabdus sp.]|nr:DUF3168 domain-containing protein [Sandarakinorhabdus sp.]
GGKSSNAEQHDVTVRLFVPGTSKAGLFALAAQVKAALHNQVLPAQPGAAISRCAFVSAGELRDIDEGTLIEEMRFRLFASPA